MGKTPVFWKYSRSATGLSGQSRRTAGCPAAKADGSRGVYRASISPATSSSESVRSWPMGSISTPGTSTASFSTAARRLQAARPVGDGLDRHAVQLGQHPADPHDRRELVLGHADHASAQVRRLVHSRACVHVHPVVPERPRREHRHAHERSCTREADHIGRQRELGCVELAEAGHAEEGLLHGHREVPQLDALRLDAAVGERGGPVVVPAGEGERPPHAGHLLGRRDSLVAGTVAIRVPVCQGQRHIGGSAGTSGTVAVPACAARATPD